MRIPQLTTLEADGCFIADGEVAHAERPQFRGLVNRRVKAFWGNWEQAQSGHPGHMLGCAKQAAAVTEVYVAYYIRVANLGLEEIKAMHSPGWLG